MGTSSSLACNYQQLLLGVIVHGCNCFLVTRSPTKLFYDAKAAVGLQAPACTQSTDPLVEQHVPSWLWVSRMLFRGAACEDQPLHCSSCLLGLHNTSTFMLWRNICLLCSPLCITVPPLQCSLLYNHCAPLQHSPPLHYSAPIYRAVLITLMKSGLCCKGGTVM